MAEKFLGIPAQRAALMAGGAFCLGGGMELFMIKGWLKDTNCNERQPRPLH